MPKIIFVCIRCRERASRLWESNLAKWDTCGKIFTIMDSNTKIIPDRAKKPKARRKQRTFP